jgi:import inner membrane translocase subunit TIM23
MGLGYLLGPTLGNTLFSLTHRTLTTTTSVGRQRVVGRDAINTMDKAFHDRIRARRGDPSYQSVNNPAPDYYGEKVGPNVMIDR